MSELIDKTFNVSLPARLNIRNIRGSIELRAGEENAIQIVASMRSSSGDEKHTQVEISQSSDGTVTATTHFPDGSWNWLFGSMPCEVDYVVKAPRQCYIKASGVSSSILAVGFEGELHINTVSGETIIQDHVGPGWIHTVSGDVEGDSLRGPLDINTVSGDISIKSSILASIKTNSVSGDMSISTPLTDGPYEFKSVSGDVRLELPPETRCSGEIHSISGDLVTSFPVSGISRQSGSQVAAIQGGGVKLHLHSVSGDLVINSSGPLPTVTQALMETQTNSQLSVLERLERGELTVDEALGQLNQNQP